jgi:serine/threonine protein kinase
MIVKLARESEKLPPSLYVEDITYIDDHQSNRRGGFSDVFKGLAKDGSSLAIKRPRELDGSDAHKVRSYPHHSVDVILTNTKLLCREALVWRQLKHPNVLQFIGLNSKCFPDNILPCLLAPWMDRGTLKEYVKSDDYDPRRDIVNMLKGIASGLAYLHSLLVIHGDITHVCLLRLIIHLPRIADISQYRLTSSSTAQAVRNWQISAWFISRNLPAKARSPGQE